MAWKSISLNPLNSKSLRITAEWTKFPYILLYKTEQSNKAFESLVGFSRYKSFILFVLYFLFILNINAQSQRGELEAKRQQILKQIETTTLQLTQTQQSRAAARDRLEALQGHIETRESLINTLHEEIDETDLIIERTEEVLNALNNDIKNLRTEYALTMRKAYKMKMPSNSILFLMSSKSFTDAYKRWQYFRQYDKFRVRQAQLIVKTQESLTAKNALLANKKSQKIILALTNEQQKELLSKEQKDKDRLIDELKEEENRLGTALKSQEKQNSKLNSAIEKLIYAEIEAKRKAAEERTRKAREAAEKLAKERSKERNKENQETLSEKPKAEIIIESSENLALSSDFRSNKGKLPPPAAGTIVRGFGRQKVLDKVTSVNNGIDIRTETNADVRAVFNGTVSIVSSLPGMGYVVLVQHGNYYSVYSNLSSVWVKKGDAVTTRQTIGKSGINNVTNESEVHFEVWLEKTHLNPTSWISR